MEAIKKQVKLSSIKPAGTNPREDFGDIEALAATIEATGGEPVNPIVTVEDGNVYRIVDGERRWRAMRSLYVSDPDRMVTVLAYPTMEEANQVVAMLATDDKQQLTELERSKGVQQMLVLGVDEEKIARAARTTSAKVAAARKMRGRIKEGEQATLDQMLAAAELPDEYADKVMAAGKGWETAVDKAKGEIQDAENERAIRAAVEAAGLKVVESTGGDVYVGIVRAKTAGKDAEDVMAKGATSVTPAGPSSYWYAYGPASQDQEDPEEAERQRAVDEDIRVCGDMSESMLDFIFSPDSGWEVSAELTDAVRDRRDDGYSYDLQRMIDRAGLDDFLFGMPVSRYEAAVYLCKLISEFDGGILRFRYKTARQSADLVECFDAMQLMGWQPSEEFKAKREQALGFMEDGE